MIAIITPDSPPPFNRSNPPCAQPSACRLTTLSAADYPVSPAPFTDVKITDGLWKTRQDTNNHVTLPFAIGQCETSKRVLNFDFAAETMKRRAAGETTFQNKPPTTDAGK